jgi:hypothetical protein
LQQRNDDVEIIFMHIPIRMRNSDDENIQTISEDQLAANDLLRALDAHPSVRLIVAGHTHDNKIRDLKFPAAHQIPQLETCAFARSTENWRLIKLTGDMILISNPGDGGIQYTISID